MKKHRHKWSIVEDCHCCGSTTEFCLVEGCMSERICDAGGKCQIE